MIEKAVVFGPDRSLVGVWTEPQDSSPGDGKPAVIILNSGIVHHVGIWRLHVRMARALAEHGVPSLRFDLSGIGDSDRPRVAISPEELILRDVDAAIHYVSVSRGVSELVMMGLCSGARDGLEAGTRHQEVAGVIAIDLVADLHTWQASLVHFSRRMFRLESWLNTITGRNRRVQDIIQRVLGKVAGDSVPEADPDSDQGLRSVVPRDELSEMLSALLSRDVELFFPFSSGLEENYNHRTQFAEALPKVAADPRVVVDFFPRADHTFSRPDQQRALIESIVDWVSRCFGSGPFTGQEGRRGGPSGARRRG